MSKHNAGEINGHLLYNHMYTGSCVYFMHKTGSLTPCRQAAQKCVIAIPCVVDGSRLFTFSYTTSCTCVCQLVWLTFRIKVIDSLMQDTWVSSYK